MPDPSHATMISPTSSTATSIAVSDDFHERSSAMVARAAREAQTGTRRTHLE